MVVTRGQEAGTTPRTLRRQGRTRTRGTEEGGRSTSSRTTRSRSTRRNGGGGGGNSRNDDSNSDRRDGKFRRNEDQGSSQNMKSSSSSSSSVWSDLPRRLLTICIGFPLVVKMLQSSPKLAYVFFAGAHFLSAWEYTLLRPSAIQQMSSPDHHSTLPPTTWERLSFCFLSVGLAAIPSSSSSSSWFLTALTLSVGFIMLSGFITSSSGGQQQQVVVISSSSSKPNTTTTTITDLTKYHWTVGLCFITIPFRSWCQVATVDFPSTLAVLLVVWNTDTGALLAGRIATMIYNHRRRGNEQPQQHYRRWKVPDWILRISPKKSMEGFVGGILGGVWTAHSWIPYIVTLGTQTDHSLHWLFTIQPSSSFHRLWGTAADDDIESDILSALSPGTQRLLLGIMLATLAIIGDLVESSIKRQSQSKDSGSALPGHGGILDRFDSSLLAIVVYQALLEMM